MAALTADELAADASARSIDERRRSAIRGAFWSEFIDMFDIYLPVVVLAPVLPYFQPKTSSSVAVLLASLVFVTTLIGRPIGALLFGLVADKLGRRRASIYSVSGFAAVTLLIAVLPDYQHAGAASYGMLVLLRFVDGIFLGGGYTGAIPLAMEYSRKSRRGFVGGLIGGGFCAAYVSISLIAMLMFALFPFNGPHSPYAQWGWRIPFVFGAVLGAVLALYYVRKVSESEIWQSETGVRRERKPLSDLLGSGSWRGLLQVLLLMTGFWITQNMITLFLPTGLLRQALHLDGLQVTSTLLIAYCLMFFSYVFSGMIGQRIGRRRFFVIVGTLIATVGAALLYVLARVNGLSMPMIILLVCALSVLVPSPWGVILTYLNERFVTNVRATGFGIGLSLSVVIPSFYAFYMNWLGHFMPPRLTPVVLLCVGAVLGVIGALMGPETRDVDF